MPTLNIEIEDELAIVECEADDCHRESRLRVKVVSTEGDDVDSQEFRLCDIDAYAIASGAIFIVTLSED